MAPIPKESAKSDEYDYLVIGGGAACPTLLLLAASERALRKAAHT
jgi:hypothetical protein